ncbi:M23 family metallopeptidase [Jatrophihabitans endophyticus]|uniref:M23 family metallopeptidase n=1 Tax=Jatrophihabitans endophyticus TaxID=1206085 RepID=UPI001A006611|nr:M23 family metallopeptidase [Jatrophihabitans endophyticus]MBE7190025.1 M23 family metallopeptidase [Jatrophihabitans endophyticus]
MERVTRARAPFARQATSSRIIVLLAALATLAGLLGVTAASSSAAAAHRGTPTQSAAPATSPQSVKLPRATSRHPFSNPVWLPLHSAFGVDCAGPNPGCTSKRTFFSIDIVPQGQFGKHAHKSHAKVYSMGAGVVHIGQAHGTRCGNPVASFGTWIWISHGSGVVSRYGHLSKILVKNGQRVAAGTPIGVVGTTGKAKNCGVSYTDFMVDHHGLANADSYHFDTLRTCSTDGVPQTWPAQAATRKAPGSTVKVHFTKWDKVAHGTQFPASSGDCIPGGAPNTTTAPAGVKVAKPAANHLKVSWAAAPADTRTVAVEVSVYHPSEHSWARAHNEVWRTLPGNATSVSVSGLMHHHLYRSRVSFMGPVGSSRASSWVMHRD